MSSHKEEPNDSKKKESHAEELKKSRTGKRRQRSISAPAGTDVLEILGEEKKPIFSEEDISKPPTANERAAVYLRQVDYLYSIPINAAEKNIKIREHYDSAFEAKPTDFELLGQILGYYALCGDEAKQYAVRYHVLDVVTPLKPEALIEAASVFSRFTSGREVIVEACYDLAFEKKIENLKLLGQILGHHIFCNADKKQQAVLDRFVDLLTPNNDPVELIIAVDQLPVSMLHRDIITKACYEAALNMQPQDPALLGHMINHLIEKKETHNAKQAFALCEDVILGNSLDEETKSNNNAARVLVDQGAERLHNDDDAIAMHAAAHYKAALELKPTDITVLKDIALYRIHYQAVKAEDILIEGSAYLSPVKKALLLTEVADNLPEPALLANGKLVDQLCEVAFELGSKSLTVLAKIVGHHLREGEQEKADFITQHIIEHFPYTQNQQHSSERTLQLGAMARMLPDDLENREYIAYSYYEKIVELEPYNRTLLNQAADFFHDHANVNNREHPTARQKAALENAVKTVNRILKFAYGDEEQISYRTTKICYLRLAEEYDVAKEIAEGVEARIASSKESLNIRMVSDFYLEKGHIFLDEALKAIPGGLLANMTNVQRELLAKAQDSYTKSWQTDCTHARAFQFSSAGHHNLWQQSFCVVARKASELLTIPQTVESLLEEADKTKYFPIKRFAYSLVLDRDPTNTKAFQGVIDYRCQTSLSTHRGNRVSEDFDRWSYGKGLDKNPVDPIAFQRYCEIASIGGIATRVFNALAHDADFEPAKKQLLQLQRAVPEFNVRAWNALQKDPTFSPALELLEMVETIALLSPIVQVVPVSESLTTLSMSAKPKTKATDLSRVASLSELALHRALRDKKSKTQLVEELDEGENSVRLSDAFYSVIGKQKYKQWTLKVDHDLDQHRLEQQKKQWAAGIKRELEERAALPVAHEF